MELQELQESARQVRSRFGEYESRRYGRSWTPEEIMLGFVGDVGDLAKLVQGKDGVRDTIDLDAKLAHELADCLWSVLILADSYHVDVQQAFRSTMADLNRWLDSQE
ncbi:nucleotide pyrophosphohydrolase [Microlunatus elymi]|uniref:Nucleotide pyrophosphohydrolase n=1 Tax=Microlunatus elymi TaxID=2596828 RepID=A0A516PY48_9ACTN|nr:MazG nucleotide pyrophosphohydrolase domain-containing protein [Microlunatus elymi]QDP96098.1 nucleotide pyrophosphohydrolase [Microlunatus elymi]